MQLVFKVWALGFYIDPWRKGMALIILRVFFYFKEQSQRRKQGDDGDDDDWEEEGGVDGPTMHLWWS